MVNRIHRRTFKSTYSLTALRWIGIPCLLSGMFLPLSSPAARAKPYAARAHITGVEHSFLNQRATPIPGAGLRSFQNPDMENSGTERFDIRWHANPPGIPPGALIMLESVQARNPVVKNHLLRLHQKSEGNIQSIIEIPAEEIRPAGRILKWRVRIIWRGRALASRTSPNWEK